MLEPLHYLLCKTGKSGCDTTCTHQYLTIGEVMKELNWNSHQSESEKFFAAVNDNRVSLVNFGHWRNGSADENDIQNDNRARELAEVDSALLTDDLPPTAYTDPGQCEGLGLRQPGLFRLQGLRSAHGLSVG